MVYSQPAHLHHLARSILPRELYCCGAFDGELCRRRLLLFGDAILCSKRTRIDTSSQYNSTPLPIELTIPLIEVEQPLELR